MQVVSIGQRMSDNKSALLRAKNNNFRRALKSSKGLVNGKIMDDTEAILMKDSGILYEFLSRIMVFLMVMSQKSLMVFADSMTGLGDIYQSNAFVGNTKWLEKFNFVGTIVQAFISVFGLLIAVIVVMQIVITIIYFANKELWNSVSEAKTQNSGIISYTFGGAFSGGVKSVAPKGSDIIMNYIMLLLPNIKKYSEAGADGADENWTLTTWFMSTFINKCILLLVVSMTINGSMMQAYMMVVDGMGVIASTVVETDLEGIVQNQVDKMGGKNYKFSVGTTGEGIDSLQGTAASKLYTAVLKKAKDVTTDARNVYGTKIEKYVTSNLKADAIYNVLTPKATNSGGYASQPLTNDEWEKVKVEVVCNSTSSATNAITVSASDLGLENSNSTTQSYYHMYFTLNKRNSTEDYWKIAE